MPFNERNRAYGKQQRHHGGYKYDRKKKNSSRGLKGKVEGIKAK